MLTWPPIDTCPLDLTLPFRSRKKSAEAIVAVGGLVRGGRYEGVSSPIFVHLTAIHHRAARGRLIKKRGTAFTL